MTKLISLKIIYKSTNVPSPLDQLSSFLIESDEVFAAADKVSFCKLLSDIGVDGIFDIESLKLFRKSKKNRCFTPLETESDFRAMKRSLRVKNHIKLLIEVDDALYLESGNIHDKVAGLTSFVDELVDQFKDIVLDFSRFPWMKRTQVGRENDVVHSNNCCDVCHPIDFVPIRGSRYRCLICKDFDLCLLCEERLRNTGQPYGQHTRSHPVVKFNHDILATYNEGNSGQFHDDSVSERDSNPGMNPCDPNKAGFEVAILTGSDHTIQDTKRDDNSLDYAEKYQTLLKLIDDVLEIGYTEQQKFQWLKTMIQDSKKLERNFDTHYPDLLLQVRTFDEKSHIGSFVLQNQSSSPLLGGDLSFEFRNDVLLHKFSINGTNVIRPGQKRVFNIEMPGELMSSLNCSELKISADTTGICYKGQFDMKKISELFGSSLSRPESYTRDRSISHDVCVLVTSKSSSMVQFLVKNLTKEEIDCSDMTMEIFDCNRGCVLRIVIHKSHGILPTKIAKFNAPLSSELDYPIQVVIKAGDSVGSCIIHSNDEYRKVKFNSEEPLTKSSDGAMQGDSVAADTHPSDDKALIGQSDYEFMSSSRIMVLPSLSIHDSSNEHSTQFTAEEHITLSSEVESDGYEVLSGDELSKETSSLSDFEVLSPTGSIYN